MRIKSYFQKMRRSLMALALLGVAHVGAWGFTGSDFASGQKYYLFNIYQSKFLGAGNKLQAPNIGTPVAFIATATGFTIDGTAYTATKNTEGYYQLKNGSNFFAFEDKVADSANPDDENRAMYLGGGVTCQNTANDTDRSYWQLISETEYAEWQAKKKFTVASLNVDGMPKSLSLDLVVYKKDFDLNPDATEGPGATAIGNRLKDSGFDVVGVSEDFNYHSELWNAAWNDGQGVHYNATTHVQVLSQSTADLTNYLSKKPLFKTDGQCLFYRDGNVDRDVLMDTETRVAWNDHYGYTDHGADGLITKGYRYYVVKLADGTEFDLYTMHMDAESDAEDCAARASQLTQLVNAIKATHNGRPVIIIGDSNCRYTRDKVKTNLIDALNEDSRFTIRDPWIQFGRDGKYPFYPSGSIMASSNGYLKGEVVDKIWYVNNTESDIRIVAETYAQDLSFVNEEGSPLCDHKPCVVTFSYHKYDSAIDDVYKPEDETVEELKDPIYLRNRETGRFLKSGGHWGTHTIVGNYPVGLNLAINDGKYSLKTLPGYITDQDKNETPGQTYIDGEEGAARSVTDWTMEEVEGGFVVFSHNGRALSANDPFIFNEKDYYNDSPNYRYVILETKNLGSKLQQWEIVTKEQLIAEMKNADTRNPVNVSWLIDNPNFDVKYSTASWETTAGGRASFNLCDGKQDGADNANPIAQAWVSGDRNSNSTRWEIKQTIKDLPNGYYMVSCQAFQNKNDDVNASENIYIYANGEKVSVGKMFDLKSERTKSLGTKEHNFGNYWNPDKYYYPKDTKEASLFFNKGYFKHQLNVQITDGTLVIGIKHDDDTGQGKSLWTCFDNFQLYYLGTEQPATDYDYNSLDTRHSAEFSNDDKELTLTGIWRVMDETELNGIVNGKSPLVIDATNATLVAKPELPSMDGTNAVIKVNDASTVANTQNVIANGECANFVLTDKADFAPQQDFTAKSVTYTRANTQGYNSVCMPFAVKTGDFPETCTIYKYKGLGDGTVVFSSVDDEDEEIPAGTPILVRDDTENAGDAASWNLQLVGRNVIRNPADGDMLHGAFVKTQLETGYYKLNAAGDAFNKTNSSSTVTPFRFYLAVPEGSASLRVKFVDEGGEETALDDILADEATKIDRTYDLNGREVISITHPGLYIKGGKKIYVK